MTRKGTQWTNKAGEKLTQVILYLSPEEKKKLLVKAIADRRALSVYIRKALFDKGILG